MDRRLIKDQPLEENSVWHIAGFLRVSKSLGKLLFTNIEDVSGSIQVLFKGEQAQELLKIKRESVLSVEGILKKRKSINPSIPLGEWELIAEKYEVLSEARKVLPFELTSASDRPQEATRLKYRYLDIRREVKANLISKSEILRIFRDHLVHENFMEVFTPSLSISSQEGANTFDTRVLREKKEAIFSLSQSPQLYKQLLMIGGLERYFQIANCFRLEDLRADRQYEFFQIDIEMAFSNQEKLFSIIETALSKIWSQFKKSELPTPFPRISYDEALKRYGSDKPDLRYEFLIDDLSSHFKELSKANGHDEAHGLFIPDIEIFQVEEKWINSIITKNNIYILKIQDGKVMRSSLMNMSYEDISIPEVSCPLSYKNGTLILVTCDELTRKNALTSLGSLRMHFSKRPKAQLEQEYKFAWIVDWPLFEYNELQGKWVVAHHLFTKPASGSVGFDIKGERSMGYDLVLNGVELASGSERNNDLDVQNYIFSLAGLSTQEIEDNFGWFLEAFNYGVPPHMGIAIGVDRLVQMILGVSSIREVIAFPKNNHGICPLTNAPKLL
ncbi:aspartyl-tRNA synthetase [Mycoplasma haemofelis str. Langford 1]|uniref:Aspartyl-tRNA synthetase n=1 Tax=Mycoplasma haemofelis (strain Langford 1) TaxID=941640 RepID=E8ZJV6_MYCHL|nr:aspartate--tRNA ligase [Mycoplasma haemofelis]CBY93427.1 aspartyl-tRNA synthetase [Mycoplasma haemofelis str. Langford 1]